MNLQQIEQLEEQFKTLLKEGRFEQVKRLHDEYAYKTNDLTGAAQYNLKLCLLRLQDSIILLTQALDNLKEIDECCGSQQENQ